MRIVIGTANFIKKYGYKKESVNKQDIIKILNFAYKKKILEIDTAFDYDEFNKVKQDINLTKFKISTKCKFKKTDIKKKFFNSKYFRLIKNKLHKLNISNFENFFIHNFDELNKSEANKVLMLLNSFKSLNYIRNVGISLYEKKSLKNITNFKSLDIIQVPINIFDRNFISKEILTNLKKNNVKVQARSIFLQGFLLENFQKTKKLYLLEKPLLEFFEDWLVKNNISKLDACTSFIKKNKQIYSTVVGINNLTQFKQILISFSKKKTKKIPKKMISKKNEFIDPRKWN